MSRASNTPLLLGAGAVGALLLAAAASSPTVRRTAKKLEEKVENLVTDGIPTLLRKTSEHEGPFWSVQANLDGNGVRYASSSGHRSRAPTGSSCAQLPPPTPWPSAASSARAGRSSST